MSFLSLFYNSIKQGYEEEKNDPTAYLWKEREKKRDDIDGTPVGRWKKCKADGLVPHVRYGGGL